MSNQIDLIYAKQVETQLKTVRSELTSTYEEMVKISNLKLDFFGGKSPTAPSGMKKAIDESNALAAATDKNTIKILKSLEQETKARQALDKQRQKAIAENEKALQREQVALAKSESLYGAVRSKMALLTLEYNELATKKSLGAKLTDDESKRYAFLTTKIQGYYKVLDTVNTNIGKFQQRVGQYGGSFNPLTNSVGRLAQELPNLGQSFQIFAMSIGNNIAAFKDAIDDIRANNKVLQAEGKATSSVMSQVGASLFSLNTLLYVGIAVFIAYGKEIGDWVGQLFNADEQLKSLTESTEAFNKSRIEGLKAEVSNEAEIQKNLRIAQNQSLGTIERKIALDKIRSSQAKLYFKDLTDEQIYTGKTTEALNKYVTALKARGESKKATDQIIKNKQRILEIQKEDADSQKAINESKAKSIDLSKRADAAFGNEERSALRSLAVSETRKYNNLIDKRRINQKELNGLLKQNADNQTRINELQAIEIGLDYQEEKSKKANEAAKREDIESLELPKPADSESLLLFLEKYREELQMQQKAVSRNLTMFNAYQHAIDMVSESINGITKGYTDLKKGAEEGSALFERQQKGAENLAESMRKLKEITQSYIASFSDDLIRDAGFDKVVRLFDGTFERLMVGADNSADRFKVAFLEITEAGQQMFNTLTEASKENFDRQYQYLERKKDIEILFAGESDAAREQIEKQYEQRKRVIQERELKAQKEIARFNVLINTAQAVVSALATTPFLAGLALAGVAAAAGAVQLSAINAQQIPQYWKGTENHAGGLMMVNDRGLGSELIQTPDGKSYIAKGKDVIVNAPKGTKVKTAEQTALMFDQSLNGILNERGILSQSNSIVAVDNSGVISEIKNLTTAVLSQSNDVATFDRLGMSIFNVRNGARQKQVGNRLRIKRNG